jgi:hypothetical protein
LSFFSSLARTLAVRASIWPTLCPCAACRGGARGPSAPRRAARLSTRAWRGGLVATCVLDGGDACAVNKVQCWSAMFYRFIMPPFRALALATWRKAVLDVPNRARRRRPWPLGKKRMRTELACSATSSSAETSFLARRCTQRQARQPKRLRAVSRQPTNQRARRGLARDAAAGLNPLRALWQPEGSARDRGAPRRRRGVFRRNC